MLYANDPISNSKIPAIKATKGICPFCKSDLIPRCGSINIHHWAHKKMECSDTWYEPETQWHLKWKSFFPRDDIEVIIKKGNSLHIADYYNSKSNFVVEFQNSPLSLDERIEREMFYPNLIWVINIKNLGGFEYISKKTIDGDTIQSFRWKHPIQWIVKKFYYNIIYLLDNFPGPEKIFRITDIEHFTGCDFTEVGYEVYYNKYHQVYISGLSYDKGFLSTIDTPLFFDWLNDSIRHKVKTP